MFFELLKKDPHRIALDDGERRLSFAELGCRAAYWSRRFSEQGLQRGQHIAVLSHNRVEIVEVVLGALYSGLWVVPINSHLAPAEIEYQLRDARVALLLSEQEFSTLAPAGLPLWSIDAPGAEFPAAPELPDLDQAAGGMMMYTSGTSGRPRGVKRAQPGSVGEQFAANARAGREMGLDGSGPHLLLGPMYHAAPFLFALYDLFNGATVYIQRRFDPLEALATIERRGIAHTHFVPTMFVRCLKLPQPERRQWQLSSLSLVLHGAAPISPQVKREMIDWWGPVLVEYWGGTESGVCTLCSTGEWLLKPGSVGRSWSHWEVFAVDERGERLGPGEEGMLYARHSKLAAPFSYYGDAQKTAEAYLAPHVLTLGDYGRVDADGYVYIAARRTDLIIRGGVNIYPAEIEAVLLQHPEVHDAVAFGRDDSEWGATVHALVEVFGQPQDEALLRRQLEQLLQRELARYKHPDSLTFTGSIPRNPAGKVPRLELERLCAGRKLF